ncbi:MAG: glycosyltransferase family 2 protein [Candidatus Levybacteria bacterium]|nr:glycosyltransferase family 2 protein [Candidatus Levybacteria bacterium]
MASIFLSVVIPSFNEMGNLRKGILSKVQKYLDKQNFDYEVIVVDDGSEDGGLEFVKKFASEEKEFRVIQNTHSGKAGAVTTGMLSAKGDYILFTDMDQATPIEELEKLLPYLNKGYDVVIGSRSSNREGAPLTRKIMAKGMMVLRSTIVGLGEIKDTQCGFKLFSNAAAKDIFERVKEGHNGFKTIHRSSVTAGFDIELLFIAKSRGYKIKEVPVDWLYVETRRVSPIKDSVEGFFELFKIRRNIMSGKYD